MRVHPGRARALSWLAAASVLGFAVPAVFSFGLQWSRSAFLVPYVLVGGAFVLLYLHVHPLPAGRWLARLPQAAAVAALALLLMWRNIQGQPASAAPEGAGLLFALAWSGLAYGAMDALLLNVLPVLAVGGPPQDRGGSPAQRVRQALLGLAASLLVTTAYHAGYAEFQGPKMVTPVVGNAIITATYLASGNPLAAVITHAGMHVMAVLHGMETTVQLPPHEGAP